MKRAPVIPKHTIKTQPLEDTPSSAPAAPMVDSLIARVGAMARGNAITLPVCGRDVKFTLEVLREIVLRRPLGYGQVMNVTRTAYRRRPDDLIPSFLLTGQQTPAFGRRVSGVIEIADGAAVVKLLHLQKVIIEFWLVSWMMSRWLHCPDWVTIIGQQVLMNVVSVMQADCRMNLLEIFLRWLMQKIFHVRLLPAVSTQLNCLNQLLLFFSSR